MQYSAFPDKNIAQNVVTGVKCADFYIENSLSAQKFTIKELWAF